jgi:hypothetical protein
VTHAEQVLIRGKVFLYKQKAPFVPSGKSVFGALEYDEATDRVRCHECGKWFVSMSQHLRTHSMTASEYKDKHGLRRAAGLCGMRLGVEFRQRGSRTMDGRVSPLAILTPDQRRAAIAKRKTSRRHEKRNEDGHCPAQALQDLRDLAERLGRTPTVKEIYAAGMSADSLPWTFSVRRISDVLSLAGLAPRTGTGFRMYSRDLLIEMLRDFYVKHGRVPNNHDRRMKMFPPHSILTYHFGSMQAAYEAAGLAKVAEGRAA